MPPRLVRVISIGLPLVAAGALAGGWWWMAHGRYPLRGSMHHDFGDAPLVGGPARLDHTFRLVNGTGDTVVIEAIRPGCGCTEAEASTRRIEPGDEVTVDVELTLSRAGKKRANVALVLRDFGVQNLWVQGVGRKALELLEPVAPVTVAPGETVPFHVFAAVQSSDTVPGLPRIGAPSHVDAEFLTWERVREGDAAGETTTRWRGRFTVQVHEHGGPMPPEPRLTISLEGTKSIRVPLRIVSAPDAPAPP